MERYCDLHTHSTYSDGTLTPAQLITEAQKQGLSAIALTDHNTVAGLPAFLEAAVDSGVEAVPGVEFSTEYREMELHILGLYIRPEHYETVNRLLQQFLDRKEQANIAMIQRLNQAGIPLNYEKIRQASAGSINRAVIGAEMVRMGVCESVKEAFSQWLSPKKGYYIPPKRPDAFETIRFIKSIGAVAVLAHPFLSMDEGMLRAFLSEAVRAGLDGMEVYYSTFDAQTTALAEEIAEEYGVLKSGGSDFHGENKPDITLGSGKGNLQIPLHLLDALKGQLPN